MLCVIVDGGVLLSFFLWGLGTLVWLTFHTCCLRMTLWFVVEPRLTTFAMCVLYCFKVVSSLKSNLAKSELILVGIFYNLEGLAGILGKRHVLWSIGDIYEK